MSRGWAAFGAVLGVAAGGAVGSVAAKSRVYPQRLQSELPAEVLGAVLGAAAGAAIGAGSSAPKQVGTSGIGLAAEARETLISYLKFDRPMTYEAFLALAERLNAEPIEIVSIMALDQTRVQLVFKPSPTEHSPFPTTVGYRWSITTPDGSIFLVTTESAGPYVAPMGVAVPEKKKLSTGAIVGLSLAGTAAAGGLVYVGTRKKGRRRS
jgi:hypothetical protein